MYLDTSTSHAVDVISCLTMRGFTRHERRWPSDSISGNSPSDEPPSPDMTDEEYVEVTIDLQDDNTIILRSVEPAAAGESETPATSSASTPRSTTMRRSSSSRLLQFSQELKAEAVAKARHFSHELRRFSWGHVRGSRATSSSSPFNGGLEIALAARAMRRQRAMVERTRSGAQKALQGLRFISNRNGVEGWNEVLNNFDKLCKDSFLYRSHFAQCIGKLVFYYFLKFVCFN